MQVILFFITSSPFDFMNSPVWQLIIQLLAMIGSLATLLAFYLAVREYRQRQQRSRKELAYTTISNTPIINVNKMLEGKIEIRFDNNPIKDAKLIVMRVWNSGKTSVRREDYFEPLKFEFEKGLILSADVVETHTKDLLDSRDLTTFLKSKGNVVELPEFPFNPGDSISFSILLSGSGTFQKSGRLDQGAIAYYDEQKATSVRSAIGKFNDYLFWFLMVLETVLAIRFLLKMIGVDPTNPFVAILFVLTDIPLSPFRNIVGSPSIHPPYQAFEFYTLIAMGIYFLLFYALRRFIRLLVSGQEEPVEQPRA